MKLLFALAALVASVQLAHAEEDSRCHVGAYRLGDGRVVDIAPTDDAQLRWRLLDGRTGRISRQADGSWRGTVGWTDDPDTTVVAFGKCTDDRVSFDGAEGTKVALQVTETVFLSGRETLRGRLVMPPGQGPVPVMVLGHGSEKDSAVDYAYRQRLYPAHGVGVFVFDKRGTGRSTGRYTQDFHLLSDDVVAAVAEARLRAGARASRVGLQGGSQAGWILPLAATKTKVDFVIVGYGVAASPLVEDRTETMQDLAAAGWGPDVLAKAREVTDATGAVMASGFKDGYEQFNAVVAKYREEPWFKDLKGEFTGQMVPYPEAALREFGPKYDQGTTWKHDAKAVLARVETPLLWMLAGADTGGAGEETRETLLELAGQGRPITVVSFPGTEHGLLEFAVTAKGERQETRYAEGVFAMELDFARRASLSGSYGKAQVLAGPAR